MLYLKNGYLNFDYIYSIDVPFIFVVGGRGIGKTYGILQKALNDNIFFLLMRRTQAQVDLINKPEFNPYKTIANDMGIKITTKAISKYNAAFIQDLGESERIIGYTAALSTLSNLRGFDSSDIDLIIYDEFIPEKHEKQMKNEAAALLNAYETINRNRELNGSKPVKLIALANSNDIANPVFIELGFLKIIEKMRSRHNDIYIDKKRGYALIFPDNSEISKQKKATALYNLIDVQSEFSKMSIGNDFSYNDFSGIHNVNIKEYKPVAAIDGIVVYRHKSSRKYYISEHYSGTPEEYTTSDIDQIRFIKKYGRILNTAYINNNVYFENMLTKTKLHTILNI